MCRTSVPVSLPNCVGISPTKITELRKKKIPELRKLQSLLEQNILTEEEFVEQKGLVLDSLRKLTHLVCTKKTNFLVIYSLCDLTVVALF